MKYCYYCMNEMNDDSVFCPNCGKSFSGEIPAHHLIPGTVLHGKFVVGTALGEGGFGITYIGRDKLLDIKVAIKEYYPNGYVSRSNTISSEISTSNTEQRKEFFDKGLVKFLKEAQILAKFSGEPGVVDVRDFFEENNTAYIVMEYLEGETLKKYIKRTGKMTPEKTLELLTPVIHSLSKIHDSGLIHRDISPDNIMLLNSGNVKLLDFGAARQVSSDEQKSLSVMLKHGYAPEEQYRSKGNQGPWTDVYALSATMYKCITGITPDDSTQRVFSDELKKISELGIAVSPAFDNAIMKGLAVLQKDRYQSIEQLLDGINGKQTAPVLQDDDDDERTVGVFNDIPMGSAGIPHPAPQPVYQQVRQTVAPQPAPQPAYQQVRQTVAPQPAPQPVPRNNPEYGNTKQGKKSKIGLIAAIIAAVVVIGTVFIGLAVGGVFKGGSSSRSDKTNTIVGQWYGKLMSVDVEDGIYLDFYCYCDFNKDGTLSVEIDKDKFITDAKKAMAKSFGVSEHELDEECRTEMGMSFSEYMGEIFDEEFGYISLEAEYEMIDGNLLKLEYEDEYSDLCESIYKINLTADTLSVKSVYNNKDDLELEELLPLKFSKVK